MKVAAIIAAGGKSERFDSSLPKPFHLLNDLPIIVFSIQKFQQLSIPVHVIIPEELLDRWVYIQNTLCKAPCSYSFGQDTRFLSIKEAVQSIRTTLSPDTVFIHDAARPLFDSGLIEQLLISQQTASCTIPIIPVTDTIKRIHTDKTCVTPDRASLFAVQTPMAFDYASLLSLYDTSTDSKITDESQLFERNNMSISTVSGHPENIKITFPHDIRMAEFILGSSVR